MRMSPFRQWETQVPLPALTHLIIEARIRCNTRLMPPILRLPRLRRVLVHVRRDMRGGLDGLQSLHDPRVFAAGVRMDDVKAYSSVVRAARAFRDGREIWEGGEPADSIVGLYPSFRAALCVNEHADVSSELW